MDTKSSILIIEDDKYMTLVLNELLEDEGFNSESVNNYREAIKKIKHKEYNMLILDYNLNGFRDKNGLDIYDFAKKLYPNIKGILITAFGNNAVRKKAKEKGISQIFDKPFFFDELVNYIK